MRKTAISVGVISIASIFLWILLVLLALQGQSTQAMRHPVSDMPSVGIAASGGGITPSVKLNEIMVKNRSFFRDEAGDFDNWIELYNTGLLPLAVGGMALSSDYATPTLWFIPTDTVILSHGYLVIWTDGEPEEGAFHTSFPIGAGQVISLFDKQIFGANVIDHFAINPTAPNWSWARHPNGYGLWTLFQLPTPGAYNATHWLYLPVVSRIDEPPEINIVINEFMAVNDSTIADETGEYDDWIELHNPDPDDVDLSGMYLSDDLGDLPRWEIPAGTIISASGHLMIWADGQEDQGPLHTNFKLSGDGESLLLVDADGYNLCDWVTFSTQQSDVSFGRLPDGTDNWQSFVTPTPGGPNSSSAFRIINTTHQPTLPGSSDHVTVTTRVVAAQPPVTVTLFHDAKVDAIQKNESFSQTAMWDAGSGVFVGQLPPQPSRTIVQYYVQARDAWGQVVTDPGGAPNSTYRYTVDLPLGKIVINEFMAANTTVISDGMGDFDDWLELANLDTDTLDLSGYFLTDDLNQPTRWQFPTGSTVPPGGYLLVWADSEPGEGPLHTNFSLKTSSEAIGLFGLDGLTVIDAVTYTNQIEDISWGRYPDGTGDWQSMGEPTPGRANTAPSARSE